MHPQGNPKTNILHNHAVAILNTDAFLLSNVPVFTTAFTTPRSQPQSQPSNKYLFQVHAVTAQGQKDIHAWWFSFCMVHEKIKRSDGALRWNQRWLREAPQRLRKNKQSFNVPVQYTGTETCPLIHQTSLFLANLPRSQKSGHPCLSAWPQGPLSCPGCLQAVLPVLVSDPTQPSNSTQIR